MRSKKRPRAKFTPFLLLTLLLYGSFVWLTRRDGRFFVRTGGVRLHLRTTYGRVQTYFEWLEHHGYITEVSYELGQISGVVRVPVGMRV